MSDGGFNPEHAVAITPAKREAPLSEDLVNSKAFRITTQLLNCLNGIPAFNQAEAERVSRAQENNGKPDKYVRFNLANNRYAVRVESTPSRSIVLKRTRLEDIDPELRRLGRDNDFEDGYWQDTYTVQEASPLWHEANEKAKNVEFLEEKTKSEPDLQGPEIRFGSSVTRTVYQNTQTAANKFNELLGQLLEESKT